jgi:hypothetical protein
MLDMNVVGAFHRHYHDSILKNPDLYRNNDTLITVVLPKELLDYSNASAGHSGFGSGARAVGIRKSVPNSTKALLEIFETPESLAKFIESSDCDGPAYIETVRQRHAASLIPKPVLAKDEFWNRYTKNDLERIVGKFGRKEVQVGYNVMTIEEFETAFGLIPVTV